MDTRGIRNAPRAIIIEGGRLLCTKNKDPLGIFYLLPGGGQRKGETLHQTLKRECLEEIGARVDIGPLLYIREYIGAHHEFAEHDAKAHQVEFFFTCALLPGSSISYGAGADSFQLGVEWIPLKNLAELRIYPQQISSLLSRRESGDVYLGDIN